MTEEIRVHTVLVVDDEEPVRQLLRDTLELDGYRVVEAVDGFQGLAGVAEHQPDCVVLDVMMPGMSGIEVLAALRADPRTATLPVLMLTAADDDGTTWQGWSNGASCYVPKPFDVEYLLDWVARLCAPDEPDVEGLEDIAAGLDDVPRPATRPQPGLLATLSNELVSELSALHDWDALSESGWATFSGGIRPEELVAALGNDELWVAYQPIVALATEDLVGVEALVRWEHPQRGDLTPAEFVPLAERAGLVDRLGALVFSQATTQVADWNVMRMAAGLAPLTLSVNVAATQVGTGALATQLREAMAGSGLAPASLILELGEPALMRLLAADQREVRDLVELGVSLAFDGFAAAASSLSFLQRFHVDVVKIDRSHVRALERTPVADSTVAAIVSIAHRLGRAVIAEGVETPEQARHLRNLGCEYAQGYLFGFPAAASQLGAVVLGKVRDLRHGPA